MNRNRRALVPFAALVLGLLVLVWAGLRPRTLPGGPPTDHATPSAGCAPSARPPRVVDRPGGRKVARTRDERPAAAPDLPSAERPAEAPAEPAEAGVGGPSSPDADRPDGEVSAPVLVDLGPSRRLVGSDPALGDARAPVFSVSGGWLAWEARVEGAPWTVAVAAVAETGEVGPEEVVPRGVGDGRRGGARWHPDGSLWFVERVNEVDRAYRWVPGGGAPAPAFGDDLVGGTTEVAFTGDGSIVGFTWNTHGDGNPALRLPGGAIATLPFTRADERGVAFDPSARRAAYARDGVGLVVVDLATRRVGSVVASPRLSRPVFAGPDLVAFARADHGAAVVAVGEGGHERMVAGPVALPGSGPPAVSPDGRWLVVVPARAESGAENGRHLQVIALTGGRVLSLGTGMDDCAEPAFGVREGRILLAWVGVAPEATPPRRVVALADVTELLGPS